MRECLERQWNAIVRRVTRKCERVRVHASSFAYSERQVSKLKWKKVVTYILATILNHTATSRFDSERQRKTTL